MLENKNILDAMTEIDDRYLKSAEAFQNGGQVESKGRNKKDSRFLKFPAKATKWAAIAVITILLVGTTVYGAATLVKQLHISTYDNVEELMEKEGIEPWVSAIPAAESTFDESVYKELTPAESLIDILMSADAEASEKYTIEEGTKDTIWTRKLFGVERYGYYEEDIFYGDVFYYEAYDYAKLSDVFSEKNIQFDMSYVEENYTTIAGEYGCDYLYEDESKANCLQYRTDDGVSVFLMNGVGTEGGKLVTAEVYTEHGHLYIGMYGEFETEEVERILNSLKIAEGMGIDVK